MTLRTGIEPTVRHRVRSPVAQPIRGSCAARPTARSDRCRPRGVGQRATRVGARARCGNGEGLAARRDPPATDGTDVVEARARLGQFLVLTALRGAGPPFRMSPRELHRLLLLSPAAVTNRLYRLEAKGLIERTADPTDARSLPVILTVQGLSTIDRAMTACVEGERDLLAGDRPIRSRDDPPQRCGSFSLPTRSTPSRRRRRRPVSLAGDELRVVPDAAPEPTSTRVAAIGALGMRHVADVAPRARTAPAQAGPSGWTSASLGWWSPMDIPRSLASSCRCPRTASRDSRATSPGPPPS